MNTCYISLGSNLDNPLQQVRQAIVSLGELGTLLAQSSWYQSVAIGPGQQPCYINGVICLQTALDAQPLLSALQDIENRQGRKRNIRWGARTLDLDILLFNKAIISTDKLSIPHPRMLERNFVMFPLHEIAAQLELPNKQTVADIINGLTTQELEKLV